MTVREFINLVFLNEYQKLIEARFHYISFALMGLGIEFLGACLDNYPFDERGQSTARFKRAVRELFPSQYHALAADLCDDLRNGFAHQFRPGLRFVLTHREESSREKTSHLGPYAKQTVLIAEDLYEDFAEACRKVVNSIDEGKLNHPKVSGAFLKV